MRGEETNKRREAFRALHASGCFVMPNPWDEGSARLLQHQGFKAVASTSAGFAWTIGLIDGAAPLEAILQHLKALSVAVDVPVNADFENGFAEDLEGLGLNVMRAAATGISGLSIEDWSGKALYSFDDAVARIKTARAALDRSATSGLPALLTARSEGFIRGAPDLAETIRRLKAFAAAGADCLYAPGLKTPADIAAVVQAVAPKPVNLLVAKSGITVSEAAALGVRRISTGGALARAALGEFLRAAEEIAGPGTFTTLDRAVPTPAIEKGLQRS